MIATFFPIPVGLVGNLPADFSPYCIRDMEGELMVLYHILGWKVLHADDVIALYELCRHLMNGIILLADNIPPQLYTLNTRLLAVVAPL